MLLRKSLFPMFCLVGLICIVMSIALVPGYGLAETGNVNVAKEVININTANKQELMKLQRIGEKYAERIIEYREMHGPFEKVEDILKVKGLGQKFWEANKDMLSVGEEAKKAEKNVKE